MRWYHSQMKQYHIAINGFFWDKPTVGVGQYVQGLVTALATFPDLRITLYVPADVTPPPAPAGVTITRLRSPFSGRSKNMAKVMFEQLAIPAAARLDQVDLIHVPYFAPPLSSRIPVITTIPDLIPLTRPAYRGSLLVRAYTALVQRAARNSARLLAISTTVAEDAARLLGHARGDIDVTYLAADPIYQPDQCTDDIRTRYHLPASYIYYVGGHDERKNVSTVIRAYAALPNMLRQQYPLVIAGKAVGTNPVLFPNIDALIAQLGIAANIHRIEVTRDDNPAVFGGATCFVYPSCDEGFGLPPLEAMACRTAVIASRAACMPEVLGDAALLVDPFDISAWTDALTKVLSDAELRDSLVTAGSTRAAMYSYQRTATATHAAYMRVIAPQRGQA